MARMSADVRFFYDNAGYGYDPKTQTRAQGRRECAEALAQAERERGEGWCFTWDCDPRSWDGDGPVPDQVLTCVLRSRDGEVLTSLCGIADPSPAYQPVIEAELAMEALDEIRASVFEAI